MHNFEPPSPLLGPQPLLSCLSIPGCPGGEDWGCGRAGPCAAVGVWGWRALQMFQIFSCGHLMVA